MQPPHHQILAVFWVRPGVGCGSERRRKLRSIAEKFPEFRRAGVVSGWRVVVCRRFLLAMGDHIDSMSASDLLTQTEAAISGLLSSLADANCQEYRLPDGRSVRRAEFATTLTSLQQLRQVLQREVALQQRGGKVRLGRIVRR
jgi:hypothetical protein